MVILQTETLRGWGGQQNRVLTESVGLDKRGHKVIIACRPGSVLSQKAKQAGIKVYEMDMVKGAYLSNIPKLINIIKEEGVDLLSTHSSVDSWAGGLAAKYSGRRLIRFRQNLYPVGRGPLAWFIYSIPDRIIANSNACRNVLTKCGVNREKIVIIPDSVDIQRFDPVIPVNEDLRAELGISPETLIIGNTSTFTEVKGQIYLLQAFNIINKKFPCILMFAGDLKEPFRSQHLSYVNEEFRDKVIFLVHKEDIPRVLKTIDIYVFPSYLEGLGTALLEAMAMERPVAVSDIPTFREFIEDKVNGVFFKVKNTEDLAEKVVSLLNDKELREKLGKNARATIQNNFSLERMLDLTEALYKEVIHAA
ncbi:MAG: glycosyltransferase family 4 protein [Nitrospirae bacterium]|nr:glycosyltransferase family 4 protein [Nitrospirota bacterium]